MRSNTMSRRGRILLVVGAAAVALLGLTGCGSGDPEESAPPPAAATSRSYVGRAAGSEALVAVVTDGARVLAYVCDGMPGAPSGTAPTIQAWFNGPSDGISVDVTQPAGRLQLELTDAAMTGTVTLAGGRTLAVNGRAATGDAGLYRAETPGPGGAPAVAGWILAADGTQRGGVGGSLTTSGTTLLNTSQLSFSFQSLATARISRVGITPIPIP